jgi:hypothetical protein
MGAPVRCLYGSNFGKETQSLSREEIDVELGLEIVRGEFSSLINSKEPLQLQPILRDQEIVADATLKFVVKTKTVGTFFAIVSNAAHPLVVAKAISKQDEVGASLDARVASVIEPPVLKGFAGGVSYGVWPYRKVLSNRLQRFWLSSRLFQWLYRVTESSAHTGVASVYEHSLCHFLSRANLPQALKKGAQKALMALHDGDLTPMHVAQHGDFWHGNVLLPGAASQFDKFNPWGFYLIDWAGAEKEGYPFFDLLKLAGSLGLSRAQLSREVERHSRVMGIQAGHPEYYFLAGLAHLGTKLENFPEDRYLAMGVDLHARLAAA